MNSSNISKIGYTGAVGEHLIIPETFRDPDDGNLYKVVEIAVGAFSNCVSLTSITIPQGVTRISGHAFSGCSALKSIDIPNSVTSVGTDVFRDCTSLTTINIDKPINSITGAPWGATKAIINWLR